MLNLQPSDVIGLLVLFMLVVACSQLASISSTLGMMLTVLKLTATAKPGTSLTDSELRSFLEQSEGAPPVQARFHIPRALFPEKPPVELEYR